MTNSTTACIKLGLPKGRMEDGVYELLNAAGIHIRATNKTYRPSLSTSGIEAKILKPQDIVHMLALGSRDVGFTGADWVQELDVELVKLLDTALDPVRLVAAAPESILERGALPRRSLVVASEYETIAKRWIRDRGMEATFLRSYGATEVFPPEDADCIVDNTATGVTLKANHLVIIDELMTSSTCLYANPASLENREKRELIERFVLLISSVLDARNRVMVEVNVSSEALDRVVSVLPCMREPTISPLHHGDGFAVKAAVAKKELPRVIPAVKEAGGTDIVVMAISQLVA